MQAIMDLEQQVQALLSVPGPEVARQYLQEATKGLKLEVRESEHGKGLFATRAINEGEEVLREAPLVGVQHCANAGVATACARCFRFVGTLQDLAQLWLTREHGEEEAARDGSAREASTSLAASLAQLPCAGAVPLPTPVACPAGCGELYCGAACRQAAARAWHGLLCPARPGASAEQLEALEQFQALAEATNDALLLAARVLAATQAEAARLLEAGQGGSGSGGASRAQAWAALQEAWRPYSLGHKALWWGIVPAEWEDAEQCRADRRELSEDAAALLRAAVGDAARFPALWDARLLGGLMGMFELNNLSVFVASPLARWAGAVAAAGQLDEAEPVLDALGDLEGAALDGTAFYSLQSCANHSCAPSVHAFKAEADDDGSAVLVALHNIAAGEEVTISYIDEDAPYAERQETLAEYGFACACDKCAAEVLAAELDLLDPKEA